MPEAAYGISGRTVATAATINHAICSIWNPHATKRIAVTEFGIFKTAAGTAADSIRIARTSARGTPGSTITPVLADSYENHVAPPSGFLLDLAAFSVQPTLVAGGGFRRWMAAAVAGSAVVWPFRRPIVIPPGAGLAILQNQATIWPISDVYFEIDE